MTLHAFMKTLLFEYKMEEITVCRFHLTSGTDAKLCKPGCDYGALVKEENQEKLQRKEM